MILEPFIFQDALIYDKDGFYVVGLADWATPEQRAAYEKWQADLKEAKKDLGKL